MVKKKTTLTLSEIKTDPMPEHLTYQARLRAAAFDGVGEQDIKEMIQAVVQDAKGGNLKAVRIVFDYLLGGNQAVHVHNHFESIEDGANVERIK